MRDYYEVLGVPRSASLVQIRRAFKDLARKHHPDRNPGDEQAERLFKEASAAYAALADAEKRSLYDEFGYDGLAVGFRPERARLRNANTAGRNAYGSGVSFNDILGGQFSGDSAMDPEAPKDRSQGPFYDTDTRRARPVYGSPIPGREPGRDQGPHYGAPPPRPTPPPPRPQPPRHSGRVRAQTQPSPPKDLRCSVEIGPLVALQGGDARVRFMRPTRIGGMEEVTLRVQVPAGTNDGAKMRLRGQGGQTQGRAGDVLLEIRVRGQGPLRQVGRDLELDVPVTIGEAMLGGRIEVQTPLGVFKVIVPSGSDRGTRIRIRGRGAPGQGRQKAGDLFFVLCPVLPDQMSEEMLDLVRKLEDYYTRDVRHDLDFEPGS
ncbi:MAG: DnaJ-class molecular chaperone [Cognaticolwellia sp.]|jgi:DnaJ-class molecular chaperone